jgi:hypothetical protein
MGGGTVPLSEHEQKLLSQMEQQLVAEDPKFASTMRGRPRGPGGGKQIMIGALGVVLGLALIVVAVAQNLLLVAIPGFLLMIAGVWFALSRRPGPVGTVTEAGTVRARRPSNETFINRLEERWDRRREQDS